MKIAVKRAIWLSVMGIILAALLAGNIVCGMLFQMITEYFHGTGISFEGEELAETLTVGDELCSEIEGEGIVMLKNSSGTAPLKGVDKVNVFGWAGSDGGWTISGYGSGASRIPSDKQVKFLSSLTESKIDYNKDLADMYKNFRSSRTGLQSLSGDDRFFTLHEPDASVYDEQDESGKTLLDRAYEYSPTAIVVISRQSGEGIDVPNYMYRDVTGKFPNDVIKDDSRTYLQISPEEEAMLEKVEQKFDNVIVLLNTTNVMEAGFLESDGIDAAYWVGAPGQSGTRAIPKVLKGDINPSGRTTSTWAYDHKADPSYANSAKWGTGSVSTVTYVEDVYVGYKWYETAAVEGYFDSVDNEYGKGYDGVVQYPFGYGMSYNEGGFTWTIEGENGGTAITPAPGGAFTATDTVSITVRVENTGDVAGKDVVQVYVTPPYRINGIEKAHMNLVAFAKTVELAPGASQYITLSFSPYDFASYDAYDKNHNRYRGYELDSGTYTVSIARNSHDVVHSFDYTLDKNVKFRQDPVTQNQVVNRFTGSTAYGGASIDAKDLNSTLTYMTRFDFAGTFPTERFAARNNNAIDQYTSTAYDTTEEFTYEQDADLRLYTSSDGGFLSLGQLNQPQGVIRNESLMMALGEDYEDPQWDTLLSQMSVDEMVKLIVLGGYHTEAIESVGKIWLRENDGPMGLTRSNASPNEVTNWTWYPMVGVLAASWNSRLAFRFGNVVSAEANYTGVHGWYAPGFNLIRSPYGGRNNEYYSEDPTFSGLFGAETVRGALANGVSCYIKHFVVNETETNRSGLYTWLTEQNLRENYLRPFEIAVKKGGANGIMSSFNRLGSGWTGANHALCTDILRTEWGFRGAVITDWTGAATGYMSGEKGVRAGNDLWLTGTGSESNDFDTSDPTTLACLRRSSKNILFQLCNTFYKQQTHEAADDEYIVSVGVLDVNRPFPSWIFLLIGIDVVVLAAITVGCVLLFRRRRGVKVVNHPDGGNSGNPSEEESGATLAGESAVAESACPANECGSAAADFSATAFAPIGEEAGAEDTAFTEAYEKLNDTQKAYLEKVRAYAMAKEGATERVSGSGVTVKLGGKTIVKLKVRRGIPVASYKLDNETLNKLGVAYGETVIKIKDDSSAKAACDMVDVIIIQYEKAREDAAERRRAARRARAAERRNSAAGSEDKDE